MNTRLKANRSSSAQFRCSRDRLTYQLYGSCYCPVAMVGSTPLITSRRMSMGIRSLGRGQCQHTKTDSVLAQLERSCHVELCWMFYAHRVPQLSMIRAASFRDTRHWVGMKLVKERQSL